MYHLVESMEKEIVYGSRKGQHFTQWRFDNLTLLAVDVAVKIPEATGFSIWYDDREDFHYLQFTVGSHTVLVRYYKVYAVLIDGSGGDRWPTREPWGIPRYVLSQLNSGKTADTEPAR